MATQATQRKVLAVLAGGLVLGVGTAVTLAAWNDSEFANGTFTAGSFNLQGSTTGDVDAGYADHASSGAAATLEFDLPADLVDNMAPGDTVYAPLWLRLAAGTSTTADLAATGITAGTGGNEANFSYTISVIGAADTCDDSATGTVLASGADLTALTAGTDAALAIGTPTTDAGAAVQLCFAVTAGAQGDLVQGDSATATWQFTATSN